MFKKDFQYYKFCAYGFLKNMRFFDPFILLFFREIGFSYLQIGFLFSIREISNTMLEVPSGVAADYLGRKYSMLLSFAAYMVSFIIFTISSNYYLFFLAMFLFAIGESFRSGTHKAMIIDYLKLNDMSDLKTEYYGSTRAWSQIGSAISSLVAGGLVLWTGNYRIVFSASILPYVFDFINLATYPAYLNGLSDKKSKKQMARQDFRKLFTTKEYRRALLNSAVYDGMFKSIKDYLQQIVKSFALGIPVFLVLNGEKRSAIIIALVYFILFFLSAAASKNSYRIKQIFRSNSRAINITFIFGIIITAISGIAHSFNIEIVSILFFISVYMLQNLRRPVNTHYISNHIPDNLMATGLSVETQAKTITIAILSPVIGYLADVLGVGYGIFIVSAALLVLFPILKVRE
jgi:MFS family permease